MARYSGRRYVNVTHRQDHRRLATWHRGAATVSITGSPKALMWAAYLIGIRGTLQRPLDFDQFCEVIRPPMILRPGDPMYPFELVPLA